MTEAHGEKPQTVLLTRDTIAQRIISQAEVVRKAASPDEILGQSRFLTLLVSCLNAPGPIRYDESKEHFILPGDEILARNTSNENLSPRELRTAIWRLSLQAHLTDDALALLGISERVLSFTSRLRAVRHRSTTVNKLAR